MSIKKIPFIYGQVINDTCYVADKNLNLAGWYDFKNKILHIWHEYKYTEKLIAICKRFNINYEFCEMEPEIIEYYERRYGRTKTDIHTKDDN